ncbi:MAG: DUF362 domain-containing protein [Verrucomicrobia bacterium]|nr:DUF362 domain-containing protein [Verrucomicrobiota bacterium]
MSSNSIVAIWCEPMSAYPERSPYHPGEGYPEYPFGSENTGGDNAVYEAVRQSFHLLGYDKEHYGERVWNPLGQIVRPGDVVFIKPNMIAHKHLYCDDWEYVITHGSVVRAVLDYVFIALDGSGKVIIGDGPQTDSKWGSIIERMGLKEIQDFYASRGLEIELVDLRDEHWIEKDGIYIDKIKLAGDPRGGRIFDLGCRSMFAELDGQGRKYYGAFYDIDETNRHHSAGKHEYAVSLSPIEADVFINIPKLKTHKKCGLTVNLKSLVGINANKNLLPHYVFGGPEEGGDQFDKAQARGRLENTLVVKAKKVLLRDNKLAKFAARKIKRLAYKVFGDTEEVVRSGNWHGNDTVWRMCLDLNRILMFGNPDGTFRGQADRKRFLSVVDGIIGMDGNGPVAGKPRSVGVVLAGDDPVTVDAACARLMGFDRRKLAIIARAFDKHDLRLTEAEPSMIRIKSNVREWDAGLHEWRDNESLSFEPHFGWIGQVEL